MRHYQIDADQLDQWQLDPNIEIVPERGVCRLLSHRKTFDKETLVTKDGAPLIMKATGKALHACDVLPERADLALSESGRLLSQAEFESNYMLWLSQFIYPEGTEIQLEPVPNVIRYVSEMPDPNSDSRGMVEMYFDPRDDDAPEEQPNQFDTDGEPAETKASGILELLTKAMVEKMDPAQLEGVLSSSIGKDIPVVNAKGGDDEVPVAADGKTAAPCGKLVKNVGAHKYQCRSPECNEDSE